MSLMVYSPIDICNGRCLMTGEAITFEMGESVRYCAVVSDMVLNFKHDLRLCHSGHYCRLSLLSSYSTVWTLLVVL